jgi:hypothetical protein
MLYTRDEKADQQWGLFVNILQLLSAKTISYKEYGDLYKLINSPDPENWTIAEQIIRQKTVLKEAPPTYGEVLGSPPG